MQNKRAKREARQKLETVSNLEISDFKKRRPAMILTGIDSQLSKDEVFAEIKSKNVLLMDSFGTDFDNNFKIVHVKTCKNPKRQNYFIEMTSVMFKFCSKEETLNVKWTRHTILEHTPVVQCYRCNAFGNMVKNCPLDHEICVRCGGKHCKSLPIKYGFLKLQKDSHSTKSKSSSCK